MSKLRVVLVLSIIMAFYIEKSSVGAAETTGSSKATVLKEKVKAVASRFGEIINPRWFHAKDEFIELITIWDELHNTRFVETYNERIKKKPHDRGDETHFLRVASSLFTEEPNWVNNGPAEGTENKHTWRDAQPIFNKLIKKWDNLYALGLWDEFKKMKEEKSDDDEEKGKKTNDDLDEATFVTYATSIISGLYGWLRSFNMYKFTGCD